ncbi:MAG: tripartite tricarboxylate transporter permease [Dethiosulfatibacter sp.]|nr:tripartite tricarboxylate transporter permease [Dethiosulfatibacter sp.]
MLDLIMQGITEIMHIDTLLFILFGVAWGTIGGMIPGINATIAMALLLPFTWGMGPTNAIVMLCGVYAGGEYGGSIPAILIGTPGTNAAACTVIDGHELHKQGKTGLALYTSLNSSVFGGFFGAIALLFFAMPLAEVALAFGPAEYFALATLGLTMICSLGEKYVFKGILAGFIGIFLSTVGFDPIKGVPRFTFGVMSLNSGFDMVALMMGFYAISEMFKQAQELLGGEVFELKGDPDTSFPKWKEIKSLFKWNVFGSIFGTIIGVMPGAGATTAAFISYSEAKRVSKNSRSFGQGNIIGVAVPESANNAATGGAMVPLLALGIPGSNSTAIMLGALMIHNVSPGPMLFINTPEIPYGIFVSLFFANLFLFLVGYMFIKFAIKITSISKPVLIATVIALVYTGAFAYSGELFSIGVTLAFGVVGVLLRKMEIPHTAVVLGFVLGFLMEANLRRGLIISEGSFWGVATASPISSVLLAFAVFSVGFAFVRGLRMSKAEILN